MTLPENISALEMAYRTVYVVCLIFLAVFLFACLIRAVRGPMVADRIVAVNMMGTMVMVIIAVMALLLKEGYLVDICIIYAMISFLAVIVLTKVYLGIFLKEKAMLERKPPLDGDSVVKAAECEETEINEMSNTGHE